MKLSFIQILCNINITYNFPVTNSVTLSVYGVDKRIYIKLVFPLRRSTEVCYHVSFNESKLFNEFFNFFNSSSKSNNIHSITLFFTFLAAKSQVNFAPIPELAPVTTANDPSLLFIIKNKKHFLFN